MHHKKKQAKNSKVTIFSSHIVHIELVFLRVWAESLRGWPTKPKLFCDLKTQVGTFLGLSKKFIIKKIKIVHPPTIITKKHSTGLTSSLKVYYLIEINKEL